MSYLKRLFIGRPLKSLEEGGQQLNISKALASLSCELLCSVAYGTEQIVLVLTTLCALAIWYLCCMLAFVLIFLISLTLLYRQIIQLYPSGGGAYVVLSENLGKKLGLTAGALLLIDYSLTVLVLVLAGAEAITRLIPALYGVVVLFSLVFIFILMGMNLAGMSESANSLMISVYLSVLVMTAMIIWGLYQVVTGAISYKATSMVGLAISGVLLALISRAFLCGLCLLTGVEAMCKLGCFFKCCKEKKLAKTLAIMAAILGSSLLGMSFLNYWYGLGCMAKVTVLSQVAKETFGGTGMLYYVV